MFCFELSHKNRFYKDNQFKLWEKGPMSIIYQQGLFINLFINPIKFVYLCRKFFRSYEEIYQKSLDWRFGLGHIGGRCLLLA